jgi:hypothetical protein
VVIESPSSRSTVMYVCVCVCVYIYSLSNVYYSKAVLSAKIPFKNPRLRLPYGAHLFHKLHSVVAAPLPVKTGGSFPPMRPSSVLVACLAKIALGT